MKSLLLLGISLLWVGTDASATCNPSLIDSYDIEGPTTPTTNHNLFCKNTTVNCCPYQAQLTIYKKWVVQGERDRFLDFYAAYKRTFESIFQSFSDLEDIARHMMELTREVEGSNCHQMAATLTRFHISTIKFQVIESIKRASKFFFESRQGFYCSLCDANDQAFFNPRQRTFRLSTNFCRKMVDNTLNFYLFRFNAFIKFARLYATFAITCDATGRFHPRRVLNSDLKFFKRDDLMGDMEACKHGIKEVEGIRNCYDYCARFNPVRMTTEFEGEIDKLAPFSGYLAKKVRILGHEMGIFAGSIHDEVPQGAQLNQVTKHRRDRVLVDGGVTTTTATTKQVINELIQFNADYKTSLLRPLSYSYGQDMTLKLKINFEDSIMKLGEDPVADVSEFEAQIDELGLDFHKKGFEALIDKETAMRIFEQLYPEKNSGPDFQSILKSI